MKRHHQQSFNSTRQRGSTIVLVVTVIVLMTMLGIAYLQVAHVQRLPVNVVEGDIEAVKSAVVAEIMAQLESDLVDADGRFFNPATNVVDGRETGRDEPYDFPFTSRDPGVTFSVTTPRGGSFTPDGGENDDMWLASLFPEGITNASFAQWAHLTNLKGVWLDLPDPDGGEAYPQEHGTVGDPSGPIDRRDSVIGIAALEASSGGNYLPRGVDVDGDGIEDSRWTWASLPLVNGVAYVMAVRIVDLNAMVNANVAFSQIDGSGNWAGSPNEPRWTNPAELDLGGYVDDISASLTTLNAAATSLELNNLIRYRFNQPAAIDYRPTPFGDFGQVRSRYHFWYNGATVPGTADAAYDGGFLGVSDEIALRVYGGLHKVEHPASTIMDFSNGLHTFLRRDITTSEGTFRDALTNMGIAVNDPNALDADDVKNYMNFNPRGQMTVSSGAAIFAPRLPGELTDRPVKLDINRLIADGNLVNDYQLLTNLITAVYAQNTPATLPAGYTAAELNDFARHLALSIVDYADEDNFITVYDPGGTPDTADGNEIGGFEGLPIVSEVYVQGKYEVTFVGPNAVDPMNLVDVTRQLQGRPGFAIEFRNPLNKAINLETVELFVNGARVQTLGQGANTKLSHLANNTITLDPGQALILWQESEAEGGAADANNDIRTLLMDETETPAPIIVNLLAANTNFTFPVDGDTLTAPLPGPITTKTVDVELRATIEDGTATGQMATWPYSVSFAAMLPDEFIREGATAPGAPVAEQGYLARGYVGSGEGINVLAVRKSEFVATELNPGGGATPTDGTIENLGQSIKNFGFNHGLDPTRTQITMADRDPSLTDLIHHVGELYHIAILGPNFANVAEPTYAGFWGGVSTNATVFMIDPNDSTNFMATASNAYIDNVNHATFLAERLVTYSPLTDGENNDNIGAIDDDDEVFIPGTINLNTIPYQTLVRILPITDATLRVQVATLIVNRRNMTDNREGDGTTILRPGITFAGELQQDFQGVLGGTGAFPGDTSSINGVRTDFLSNDSAGSDGVADDREENSELVKWIGQVGSGRSDRFCAYIKIQGYLATDFRNGGDGPIEEAWCLVLFDRSKVGATDGAVRVLGVYEPPQ